MKKLSLLLLIGLTSTSLMACSKDVNEEIENGAKITKEEASEIVKNIKKDVEKRKSFNDFTYLHQLNATYKNADRVSNIENKKEITSSNKNNYYHIEEHNQKENKQYYQFIHDGNKLITVKDNESTEKVVSDQDKNLFFNYSKDLFNKTSEEFLSYYDMLDTKNNASITQNMYHNAGVVEGEADVLSNEISYTSHNNSSFKIESSDSAKLIEDDGTLKMEHNLKNTYKLIINNSVPYSFIRKTIFRTKTIIDNKIVNEMSNTVNELITFKLEANVIYPF